MTLFRFLVFTIFLTVLACGGRTPTRHLHTIGVSDKADTGFISRPLDAGTWPDAMYERPDNVRPPWPPTPDAGMPDAQETVPGCEFGPWRVCGCSATQIGRQVCTGSGYGQCVCPDQEPLPASLTDAEKLERILNGMVGNWVGVGHNQWKGEYPVLVTFRSDKTYSARCLFDMCTAFYWGPEEDHPLKRYNLFDVFANGLGDGELSIAGESWGPTTGELTNVYLTADENYLRFRFYNTWSRRRIGPVTFTLTRDPNP